jgi:hypothetical protein
MASESSGRVNANISTLLQPDRQLGFVDQRLEVEPAEGDLRRSDQVEARVLDRVDLGLWPARAEGHGVDDAAPRQVGCYVRDVPLGGDRVQRVALERQLEQYRVVLQVVELLARDLCAGLEVEQVEHLAQGDVVPGSEVETRRLAHLAQHEECLLSAGGRVRVHEVGNHREVFLQLGLGFDQLRLGVRDLLLQAPPFHDVVIALLRRQLVLARLLVLVAAVIDLVQLGLEGGHALLSGDGCVDVGFNAAPAAGERDLVAARCKGTGIQHGARGKHSACTGSSRSDPLARWSVRSSRPRWLHFAFGVRAGRPPLVRYGPGEVAGFVALSAGIGKP